MKRDKAPHTGMQPFFTPRLVHAPVVPRTSTPVTKAGLRDKAEAGSPADRPTNEDKPGARAEEAPMQTTRSLTRRLRRSQPASPLPGWPRTEDWAPGHALLWSRPSVPVNPLRQQTRHFCELVHRMMVRPYSLPVRPV